MNKLIPCLSLSLALGLSACSALPSKPRTFDQLGQFSSYPLNNQTYRIGFKAKSDLSYGTAEEITLVKAAQTTVKNGFHYFKVLNDPSNRTQQPPRKAVVYPDPMFYPYSFRHPGFYDPWYNMPQVVTIDPVEVSYTIECYKDQKNTPSDAFDAFLILKSIGQKYGVSSTGDVLLPATPPH
ncbi:CC0125/CC1285 family lipoprotein [Acinetobacter brisouii]